MWEHWGVTFVLAVVVILGSSSISRAVAAAVTLGDKLFRESRARLAVGGSHACHVNWDGTVRCWGENAEGQLGIGTGHNGSLTVICGIPLLPGCGTTKTPRLTVRE